MHRYSHNKWNGSLHYNSDLSGDVKVIIPTDENNWNEFSIPGFILLGLVAQFVSEQLISVLEQAEPDEVLGLPEGTYERLID